MPGTVSVGHCAIACPRVTLRILRQASAITIRLVSRTQFVHDQKNQHTTLMMSIGVTGHRPDKLSDDAQSRLREAVARVLTQFRDTAHHLAVPESELIVVSALAEGADRIVAGTGLDAGYALSAILPFARDVYENDFGSPRSRAEFRRLLLSAREFVVLPGTRVDSGSAYAAAGLAVLNSCDVLLAVWNGRPGGKGGTGEIVQQALAMHLPVLRFDEHGNGPFLLANPCSDLLADITEFDGIDALIARIAERSDLMSP